MTSRALYSGPSAEYVLDDHSWLGSAHGLDSTESITLDISSIDLDKYAPDGFIPSGTPLGKITASGLYSTFSEISEESQTFTVSGSPTGGTFTLTFDGQTTGAIAYNASAATVQAALEALSNIAPGDILVTKSGTTNPVWTVTFLDTGAYADTNVSQITSTDSLTGGTSPAVADATATAGGTEADSDGTEVLAGFLYGGIAVEAGQTADVGAALFTHGKVRAANLPFRVSTAARADLPSIKFV